MELPPSFSENSMLVLDFVTKSSEIVIPNLPHILQKNLDISSDMKSPCPQHTTLKLMERRKGSTKRLRPTSTSSVVLTLKHGPTTFPWPSSSTTTALTPPLENPHSTLCSDMNHKPSPVSLKLPTFQLWKNALEISTCHEKKHLLCTSSHSNS